MRSFRRFLAAASIAGLATLAGPVAAAHAEPGHNAATSPAVFAQTNDPAGNAVLVYSRAGDGTLTAAGSYQTGGSGAAQPGAMVDPLASQGSVVYDAPDHLLFVVNAGSDSVSTFLVDGTRLTLRQVAPSGGTFPTSLAQHGNLLYVLNAGGTGAVSGFRIAGAKLHPIENSTRSLGLANTNPPFFLDSPGQVGFTPDGHNVVVATKRNGTIDVFVVAPNGRLTSPVINASASPVPFAFNFDTHGRLVVISAGASAVTTYTIGANSTLTVVSGPLSDGQAAGCWITGVPGGFFYVGNTGSASVSTVHVDDAGTVTLLAPATTTAGGPIDIAATSDGRFVYSENGGAGTIDEFRVESDGSLTPIGQITGLAAHVIEGIAAT